MKIVNSTNNMTNDIFYQHKAIDSTYNIKTILTPYRRSGYLCVSEIYANLLNIVLIKFMRIIFIRFQHEQQ